MISVCTRGRATRRSRRARARRSTTKLTTRPSKGEKATAKSIAIVGAVYDATTPSTLADILPAAASDNDRDEREPVAAPVARKVG